MLETAATVLTPVLALAAAETTRRTVQPRPRLTSWACARAARSSAHRPLVLLSRSRHSHLRRCPARLTLSGLSN